MGPERFKEWQAKMGWSGAELAKRMGKSPDTITIYRMYGVPPGQSVTVGLALAALESRLEPVK
jgi:transcriptional regulator with XRE-family HTH domain